MTYASVLTGAVGIQYFVRRSAQCVCIITYTVSNCSYVLTHTY